ncbi:hypothetical protein V6N11_033038 [Hibiscus sabdariffa]|uniref:Uncharacterized protein n=1 Tax=Hibiscus sabdariffa TaxID=183260 RepID=A0ABR1ZE42_9ROSI
MNPALVNEDLLLCDVVMPKRFSELEPFKPPSSPDNSSVYHEHSRPRSCCGLQGLTVVLGVKGNMGYSTHDRKSLAPGHFLWFDAKLIQSQMPLQFA